MKTKQYGIDDFKEFAEPLARVKAKGADLDSRESKLLMALQGEKIEVLRLAVHSLKISDKMKKLILEGSTENYESRSERDWAIYYALFNANYSPEILGTIFTNPLLKCSDRILEKGANYLDDEIMRAIRKMKKPPQSKSSITLGSLDEVDPKPVTWLWPNRIPNGKLSLIVGDPDVGKSFLSIDIAARVTKGEAWPDSDIRTPKGSVIILTAEDGIADTVRPRFDAAGGDPKKVKFIQSVRDKSKGERRFNLVDDLKALGECLREINDVRLIIVDPVTSYLKGRDANKMTEMREILDTLASFAEKHDVTILAISHPNKNSATRDIYRTTGSIAFTAASRAVFMVAKEDGDKDQPRRFLKPIKANLAKKYPPRLAFRILDGKIEYEKEPVSDDSWGEKAKPLSAVEKAKKFLEDKLKDGPQTQVKLERQAQAQEISAISLRRAKTQLGIEARKKPTGWFWKLPEKE